MDISSIPIHIKKEQSQTIAREKLIKVFNEISIQFYPDGKSKTKLSNLFLEVRTHRAILENKNDPSSYFEIHYDHLRTDVQPIERGLFSKYIYKCAFVYQPNFKFELKNGSRSEFTEEFKVLQTAIEESKKLVT